MNSVQTTCYGCENFPGLYTNMNGTCSGLCGDGIIRFDKGEHCDDGNKLSGDGYIHFIKKDAHPSVKWRLTLSVFHNSQ